MDKEKGKDKKRRKKNEPQIGFTQSLDGGFETRDSASDSITIQSFLSHP